MMPRSGSSSLVRASSERQLGVVHHLHGPTSSGGGVSGGGAKDALGAGVINLEGSRLLTYKSTAVSYVNGSHIHHRLLPSGSNTVFPCGSSVSLSLYAPTSDSTPIIAQDTLTGPDVDPLTRRQLLRRILRSQSSSAGEAAASAAPTSAAASGLRGQVTATTSELTRPRNRVTTAERLRINVRGQYFETQLSVLDRHPETLLGDREKRKQFFDRRKNELFFDRHRPSFEAIFCYYQYGGRLKRPHHVPDDVFLEELLFYQLEKDAVEEYKRSEGYTTEVIHLPTHSLMKRLWMPFGYPETSRGAFVIAILSVFITVIAVVLFLGCTLPVFSQTHCVADEMPNFLDPFFIIETVCTMWFTLEAIIRFIACPDKLAFWRDFKNIVDVTAIMPYYVTLFNVLSTMSCEGAKSSASLAFLRVIRLIRIFKLTKHSVGLQVLMLTFQASLEGLGLFLVALCVCLLVFSSAIYYAELGVDGSQIHSIPDAFWWAIITMTTVGYGDKVPVGYWGKLVGSACAITGVLTLAIPVPIITGHFNRFYAHKTGRGRHV